MKNLKEKIQEFAIRFQRGHSEVRWRERCIPPDEIEKIVYDFDVIETEDDGTYLLWGILDDKRMVHIWCYLDFQTKTIWVLTEYIPDDDHFTAESNYRERVKYKK